MSAGAWIRRGLSAVLVALTMTLGATDMSAQTPPRDDGQGGLAADETQALELMRAEKLLTARTKAEEILKRDPDSIAGHYVMGTALREAEGALARALAHLKRARELYERRYGDDSGSGRPWRLYADTLFGIAVTAQLMEDYEGSLQAFDDYDSRFNPKLYSQRVWPLMKLGRYDDARTWAKLALDSGSPFQKLRALNGLCAVEAEERKRAATYQACLDVYKLAKERLAQSTETDPNKRPEIVVYATNAHLGALAVLKYDEAEQLAIEATKSLEETSSNPWLRLTRLYIDEGRAAEAVSAAKALQAWRVRQPPSTREQFRAEDEATIAVLLLAGGEAGAALKLADRILERPDRRAMISTKPEQTEGANALIRRSVVTVASALEAERATYSGWKAAPGHLASAARYSAAAWPDAQRVIGTLLDEGRLIATLRVSLAGGIEYVPSWLIADLIEILGPGVFLAALEETRRQETEIRGFDAFYDAFEAEARLAQGDDTLALVLAKKALDALPKAEALFKARTAAVAAQAAVRLGDVPAALSMFENAMQADPGVVRRMGLRLPVKMEVAGTPLSRETAALLRRSPRLDDRGEGFVVTVKDDGREVETCLRTPLAAELGCARVPVDVPKPEETEAGSGEEGKGAPEDPKSAPQRAAEAFHRTMFALKMNLSESDLRSLDGGTTATRDAARQRMRELMGDDPGTEKPADDGK